jgi:hypothetical protein
MGVPVVRLRLGLRTMKRGIHPAPIALTSDGELLVNVGYFDDVHDVEDTLRRAKQERSPVFIGVPLQQRELPLVLERVHDACREGAAFVFGRRRR